MIKQSCDVTDGVKDKLWPPKWWRHLFDQVIMSEPWLQLRNHDYSQSYLPWQSKTCAPFDFNCREKPWSSNYTQAPFLTTRQFRKSWGECAWLLTILKSLSPGVLGGKWTEPIENFITVSARAKPECLENGKSQNPLLSAKMTQCVHKSVCLSPIIK